MAAITDQEIEAIRLRSITSWKRVALATALSMFMAYVSATFSSAHYYWHAFAVVVGMGAGIVFLFAVASLVVSMYFDYEARYRWDTSLFERSPLPLDRFVARDVLK